LSWIAERVASDGGEIAMLNIVCETVFVSYETSGRTERREADPTTRV
jgi:hypothetical protein